MSNITLALGMIVYNEIELVRKILNDVREGFDEVIIVVDRPDQNVLAQFSRLCDSYRCKLLVSDGTEAERRNMYLCECKCDWLITIDADEAISLDRISEIKRYIATLPDNVAALRLPIHNYFGKGRWVTTFYPKVIKIRDDVRYNSNIHHTSVSASILDKGLVLGRNPQYVEHFGSVINENELSKRLTRIRDMEKMLKEKTLNSFFYTMLAIEYISTGDIATAIKYIDIAMEAEGDKDFTNFTKALIYYRLNLDWLARDLLECVTRQIAYHGEASLILANMDALQGNIESALERAKPYLELHPESAHWLVNYAALSVDYEPQKSIECIERATRLVPTLLNSRIIYGPGAAYNPYSFQDFFVSSYDNVCSILSRAYRNLGKIKESDYWRNYEIAG